MAAPVVAALGAVTRGISGTTATVTLPAGVTTGDLLVMAIGHTSAGSGSASSAGWTQIGNASTGAVRAIFLYKFAGASEGNATLTLAVNGTNFAAVMFRITGAHATNAPTFTTSTDTSLAPTAPSIVTTVADQLVMHLWEGDAAAGQAAYSGIDAGQNVSLNECNTGSGNQQFMVSSAAAAVAGTVPACGATSTYSLLRGEVTIAIQPPGTTVSLSRSVTDTVAAADAVARSLATPRALADAVTATDSPARTVATARAPTDAITTSETLSRSALTTARSVTDVAAATDAPSRVTSTARVLADAATVTDAPSRTSATVRATTDAVAAGDAATSSQGKSRTATETVSATDTATRGAISQPRAVTDTVDVADTATRSATNSTRSTSDTVTLGDQAGRGPVSCPRAATDSVTVLDSTHIAVIQTERSGILRLSVQESARISLSVTTAVVTLTVASPKVALTVTPEELQ